MRRRAFTTLIGGVATALSARPVRVAAQRKATAVVGYLSAGTPDASSPTIAAFRQALRDAGYVEGQNLTIEYRGAQGRYERLPALAADLVARRVDVIVTGGGTNTARAAKDATATIPIVFFASDPIAGGLVASLARPGGNVTGVSNLGFDLASKRFELLHELTPRVKVVALLVNPVSSQTERTLRDVREAARPRGVEIDAFEARREGDIDAAFAALVQGHAGALIVTGDPFIYSQSERIVALAARHAVPAIYGFREIVAAGGLISFGASATAILHQLGVYAAKILGGAKPADLPVLQPTTFELVINLKSARALGLTIPPLLLARADEVIE